MRLILGLLFFGAASARAETLRWSDAVAQAARANADIRGAEEKLRAARLSAEGSYAGYFPQLNGSLLYSRSQQSVAASPSSAVDSYGASLTASQNIFSGLQDRARVEQSAAAARNAEAALTAAKAKASYDLKSAYAALLYAQRFVALEQDLLKRRQDNLSLVQLRFESGRENKGSVLLSQAYLEQARYESLQAVNAIESARALLAEALGFEKSTENLILSDDVPVASPPTQIDLDVLVLSAPDRLQASASEESAKAGVLLARGAFFPTLGLEASVGRQGPNWFPNNDRWSMGLTLSLPLFSGGRDYYATKSAAATHAAAVLNTVSVDRGARAKLAQALAAYREAAAKLKVDEAFLSAAKVRSEISRSQYNNGLISFQDWDLIENDLITRQKTALQSRRDRVVAEASFEQIQGKGVLQ